MATWECDASANHGLITARPCGATKQTGATAQDCCVFVKRRFQACCVARTSVSASRSPATVREGSSFEYELVNELGEETLVRACAGVVNRSLVWLPHMRRNNAHHGAAPCLHMPPDRGSRSFGRLLYSATIHSRCAKAGRAVASAERELARWSREAPASGLYPPEAGRYLPRFRRDSGGVSGMHQGTSASAYMVRVLGSCGCAFIGNTCDQRPSVGVVALVVGKGNLRAAVCQCDAGYGDRSLSFVYILMCLREFLYRCLEVRSRLHRGQHRVMIKGSGGVSPDIPVY